MKKRTRILMSPVQQMRQTTKRKATTAKPPACRPPAIFSLEFLDLVQQVRARALGVPDLLEPVTDCASWLDTSP